MRQSRVLALFALFTTPSLALAQKPSAKSDELPHPKSLEEFQSAAKKVLDAEQVPGAGIALLRDLSVRSLKLGGGLRPPSDGRRGLASALGLPPSNRIARA